MNPQAQPDEAEAFRDVLDQSEVFLELATRLVQRREWRARELQLSARLQRDRCAVALEPDEPTAVSQWREVVIPLQRE